MTNNASESNSQKGKIKVAIIGAGGQLVTRLLKEVPGSIEAFPFTEEQLDITSDAQLKEKLGAIQPDWIINGAAYTAVDKAQTDKTKAFAVNALGPEKLAQVAKQLGARVLHVSTDFVFEGTQSHPYRVNDDCNPISVYGESKLQGEIALMRRIESECTIIRTSWLYSSTHPCFVATMLRLMQEKPEIGVVADQVGTPTSVNSLARVIWEMITRNIASGVYHWSDAGVASWYDFAVAIQSQALALGLLDKEIPIKPLSTAEFPTPAKRPSYSVMDKSKTYEVLGEQPVHWQKELQIVLQEMLSH